MLNSKRLLRKLRRLSASERLSLLCGVACGEAVSGQFAAHGWAESRQVCILTGGREHEERLIAPLPTLTGADA